MRVTTALAATAALAALAPAQVQTTVHALTPLTFTVTDGANSSTQTQPAGPLSPFGGAGATLPAAKGGFLADVSAANPGCDVDWTLNARWFRTDYAFRYIERAWRVDR